MVVLAAMTVDTREFRTATDGEGVLRRSIAIRSSAVLSRTTWWSEYRGGGGGEASGVVVGILTEA